MQNMTCDEARTTLSALLDGEHDNESRTDVVRHLGSCKKCQAWNQQIRQIHMQLPGMATDEVLVDRTASIMGAVAEQQTRQSSFVNGVRIVLGLCAIAQLVNAVVHLSQLGAAGPSSGESLVLEFGLAGALGFTAMYPRRAGAVFPFLAVIAGVTVLMAAYDIVRGFTSIGAETSHLVEILGVLMVWVLAREKKARSWVLAFR